MADARFSDAGPGPLALRAEDADDLRVVSALAQDAVLTVGDISWEARPRRLALLVNRFRWEDAEAAKREHRPVERVRSLLVLSDVMRIASEGIAPDAPDRVLSLLHIEWRPGEDGTGLLVLHFAAGCEIGVEVECISVDLRDVTRPYPSPSGHTPSHPAD